MKNVSKLYYFLFMKEHLIIKNKKLFRFQSDLAKFAVKVLGCRFYQKAPDGIRPFLNQQLKIDGEYSSKAIKNHLMTYLLILESRVRDLNQDVSTEELQGFLREFRENYFSKTPIHLPLEDFLLFDEITADLLDSLKIVAIANGGSLSEKEFINALKNLKQKTLN